MRLRAAILMLLAMATAAMAEPIKIVAWNLEWFPGRRPDATPEEQARHMKQVQKAFKKIQPDILILTEVRDGDAVKEAVSVLPGFRVNVVSDFQLRHQQIAIASRYRSRAAWSQRGRRGKVRIRSGRRPGAKSRSRGTSRRAAEPGCWSMRAARSATRSPQG